MARSAFMVPFTVLDDNPGIEDEHLATWLRLAVVCARAMNGGRLIGARNWKSTGWLRVCGVTSGAAAALVHLELAAYAGDDLVLAYYDQQGEDLWRRQSSGGRLGAQRTNAQRSAHPTPLPSAVPAPLPTPEVSASPERDSRPPPPGGTPSAHSIALHSIENSSTPTPPGVPPQSTAATASGGRARVMALDPHAIVHAIRSDDLGRVLAAFKTNTDAKRRDDWLREADLLTMHQVATLLFQGYDRRSPVREPSGFRVLRQAYEAAQEPVRKAWAETLRTFLQPAAEAINARAAQGVA